VANEADGSQVIAKTLVGNNSDIKNSKI